MFVALTPRVQMENERVPLVWPALSSQRYERLSVVVVVTAAAVVVVVLHRTLFRVSMAVTISVFNKRRVSVVVVVVPAAAAVVIVVAATTENVFHRN